MSKSKLTVFAKFSILVVLGLALGGAGMFLYQKKQSPRRSLASIAPYSPHGLVIGKQAAAMNLEIVGPETYPDSNDEVVELVAYLTQHIAADGGVFYEWSLPEGVELVRGPLSNTLLSLPMGRAQQISILVRGFSTERQKLITLKSQLVNGSTPLVASASVVSRPEDTTDAKVMDLQAQARAAAKEAKEQESENQ